MPEGYARSSRLANRATRSPFVYTLFLDKPLPATMLTSPIFMDNHSTTPVDPRVLTVMLPYFSERFGNAASASHAFGWEAQRAVDEARAQIARLLHADSEEITFTSGATESNNLALKGVVQRYREKGRHIITVATEHKSVLDVAKRLEEEGVEVTYLPVASDGLISPDDVAAAMTDKTILISVMLANNEIGVIQPIAEIGEIARRRGVLLHCDGAQGVGKIPVDVREMGIDLLSFSAHKMYGPKGIGALYVRKQSPRLRLVPLIEGGGHERGMRSGTLNVPAVVGFGTACAICEKEMPMEGIRLTEMRTRLKDQIFLSLEEVSLNGHPTRRLPGNLNMSFAYVEGESVLMGLPDIALSTGSACTSAAPEPSYVLRALGVPNSLAHASLRFGLGRFNTHEEVDYVAGRVTQVVRRLREASPLYETAKGAVQRA